MAPEFIITYHLGAIVAHKMPLEKPNFNSYACPFFVFMVLYKKFKEFSMPPPVPNSFFEVKQMPNVYLFDFDGTLVNSMPTFISAMLRILDENHIAYGSDIVKTITPLGLNGTAEYYLNVLGVKLTKEQLLLRMRDYMVDAYFHTIPAKEFVLETLQKLRQRGASLNVLTASPHITLDACLKRLGLWDLFDNIWSCDDFNTTKADPNIYKMAAERLNTPVAEILFLDDNYHACKTAIAGGMLVCGVFDPSSADDAKKLKDICHYYIEDFSQLLEL